LITVFVEGIGLIGPGLDGWLPSREILAGSVPFRFAPLPSRTVALLPPAERRRVGSAAKLAIGVGSEALAQAERDPGATAMVFASSGGDGEIVHDILSVLSTERREVSPTKFHNSVHNAAGGYWAVATGSREPSTSLCAFDASFAAGLLDAAVQAIVDDRAVALVVYDIPYPEPLRTVRPITTSFAVSLVLAPRRTARFSVALAITTGVTGAAATSMADADLERLRLSNPAARVLPLLAAIATGRPATIRVEEPAGTWAEIVVGPT
jgi:hypothetical protein